MQVREQTRDAARPAVVTPAPKEQGVHAMLDLQRCAGNAAVNRLIVQRERAQNQRVAPSAST